MVFGGLGGNVHRVRKGFATIIVCAGALAVGACGAARSSAPLSHPKRDAVALGSTQDLPGFPKLHRGAPCPRTPGAHATHTSNITLGDGPVYPIMGFAVAPPGAGGVIDYQGEGSGGRHPGGFWGNKVLFAVPHPEVGGAITIQGKQIDGFNPVDWLIENGQIVRKLELPGGGQWYPTEALLRGSGCYALRMEGPGFARLVVFEAVDGHQYRKLTSRTHG